MRRIASAAAREMRQRTARRRFRASFDAFVAASGASPRLPAAWDEASFQAGDDTAETAFDEHYIYHPAWAARIQPATRVSSRSWKRRAGPVFRVT